MPSLNKAMMPLTAIGGDLGFALALACAFSYKVKRAA